MHSHITGSRIARTVAQEEDYGNVWRLLGQQRMASVVVCDLLSGSCQEHLAAYP